MAHSFPFVILLIQSISQRWITTLVIASRQRPFTCWCFLGHRWPRRIRAMEVRCSREILRISYKDHVTNEGVCAKIQQAIGPHEDLLIIVKRRKLKWYGHVSHSSGLAKTILQGTEKGGRRQSRQRKRWEDNIREWTAWSSPSPREQWRTGKKMEETGCEIICGAPVTFTVKGYMR